ncbi:MAG TPA: glycoside hydrolase family 5 protein [Terracidiphilus sp.]|jgi:aryl-phospho-beta-D-glucosidase BglC (GH1 family)|nr:glycoside hydrolase family 5 protein [Terracidiphilus sp.]
MRVTHFPALFLVLLSLSGLPAQTPHGFVHARGADLVDAQGKTLMLRGINLGNWFEPEGYMFHLNGGPQSPREIEALTTELIGPEKAAAFWKQWRETYITEADIDRIKAMGFNSVRVPIHWKFFDSDTAEGFRLMDRLVQWARKDGVYIVIDLHCAPGGQTGTNIDDSDGYPWLYSDAEAQRQTIAVWRRIAKHYANEPIVLGYDLLNEPIPHFPQLQRYNSDLEPLYRRLVTAIREVDRNHVVILGGAQWDSNFKVFGPPFDKNAMYTFHKYWTATDASVIQEYLDYRDKYHVPLWLGESGENKDEWIAAFTKTLEENHVGWCFWPYKKMDATSSVVTFDRPEHWDEVVKLAAMAPGTGNAEKRIEARPSPEEAQRIFDDLLKKVQFAGERVNDGYVRAVGLKSSK